MNNEIYLSRKKNLEEGFFLRVIKAPKHLAYEIDPKFPSDFSPGEAEQLDLLKVWIKPIKEPYSSVLVSENPVVENAKRVTRQIKIILINSQTNRTVDQVEFAYQQAFFESHIDDWSDRFKPD